MPSSGWTTQMAINDSVGDVFLIVIVWQFFLIL